MKIIGTIFVLLWLAGIVGLIDFRLCIGAAGSSCSKPPHTWSGT